MVSLDFLFLLFSCSFEGWKLEFHQTNLIEIRGPSDIYCTQAMNINDDGSEANNEATTIVIMTTTIYKMFRTDLYFKNRIKIICKSILI